MANSYFTLMANGKNLFQPRENSQIDDNDNDNPSRYSNILLSIQLSSFYHIIKSEFDET